MRQWERAVRFDQRTGSKVEFVLVEDDQLLDVVYSGTEAPPDTFNDKSQAWPRAAMAKMVSSTQSNCKPSVLPNMRHNSRHSGERVG